MHCDNDAVRQAEDQVFGALHAPAAIYTWEVHADLLGTQEETARIPIKFRGPVEILGWYPSVILLGADPTGDTNLNAVPRKPTTDDVMCLIDINQEDRLTNRLEGTSAAGPMQSYVTLAALGVQLPRLQDVLVANATPNVGIQFRWATDRFAPGDEDDPWWHDVRIKLAFFCRYRGPHEAMR